MRAPEWHSTAEDLWFLVEFGIDKPMPSQIVYAAQLEVWEKRHPWRARVRRWRRSRW